ncbi:MAG: helix-turn-helix domain-containing protein [Proteobacteria bacterium]|nr:helix-turn-helix domain-containing protein [Pseudomonadota bacterium]
MSLAVRLAYSNSNPPQRIRSAFQPPAKPSDPARTVTLLEHLRQLQPHALRQSLPRNHTVFAEGDSTDQVYELVSGVVRLAKHTPGGRRHVLDFVMPGEVFGLIENPEHTVTAETVGDAVIVSYSRGALERAAANNPVLRRRLVSHISDNLLTAQQQLLILGCQDAREKIASFLLRLAERSGLRTGNRLELAMGRQDIADHLGLTIETVCRTIRALHRAGTINVPNVHDVTLSDLSGLRALAVEI